MPICRRPLALSAPVQEHQPVRLSQYVVRRRVPPRSANDNRHPHRVSVLWHWAIVLAPTLAAALLVSGLI